MAVLTISVPEPFATAYTRGYDRDWCTDWEGKHDFLSAVGAQCANAEADNHRCRYSDRQIISVLRSLPGGARFVTEYRHGVFSGDVAPKDWWNLGRFLGCEPSTAESIYASAIRSLWPLFHHGEPAPAVSKTRGRQKRKQVSSHVRFAVFEQDGYRCRVCGMSADDGAVLHLDHIIPVSAGGTNVRGNLQTLCAQCNMGKSARIVRGVQG